MADLEEVLRKHALKNAQEHGKAQVKAVVGRVLAEVPDAKKNMKEVISKANEIVGEVNRMSKEQIEEALKSYTFVEKKEEKHGLRLPEAEKGKVVTRFPPEPSGYPHIGHAKAAFLDYEAARQFDGKFILRIDDTNPEKESEEYVKAIEEGLKWLGIEWNEESYVSDSMLKLYDYAERLIETRDAYVCTCEQEKIRAKRAAGMGCKCREREAHENRKLWDALLKNSSGAKGILRFRGDMDSLNTAMRDPALFRIIKKRHFRQHFKYHLWPLYDFEAPIMDSLEGVTHAMRTKEYELRDELYYAILHALNLRKPLLVEFSRLQIKNAPVSKRLLNPLIEKHKVKGWDDPRLPTLAALKRRGIQPDAIRTFVLSFGLGKAESEPGWEALLVENRKLLDPKAQRLFFVPSPVKLVVKNALVREVELKSHPTNEKLGTRKLAASDEFHLAELDADDLKAGEVFRLKDLINVRLEKKSKGLLEGTIAGEEPMPKRKVQWVSKGALKASVLVPGDLLVDGEYNEKSLQVDKGLVEPSAKGLEQGAIVQFERYGFCKLDDKSKMQFIFTNP
ncbi:glutamate--tRNA ligase [Candidatus Micrarchaeota archaeon]|nr:MAG: glutamate--tRNA ligase [Candidatus Micrarchaeota archaeon]